MQSIDSLRELNAKLLVEIAKLRKENNEISELEKKFAEVEAEAENVKLKQIIEENVMHDARRFRYNGYGGYNEYGERDRGYYYCDGRYKRKTSPMMSPYYLSGNYLEELLGKSITELCEIVYFFFQISWVA
ncbi:hypothetical protein C1645_744682 [Glomus cerebriforme]|uniref:Uncharacterized protein n=1 Tax=Glomus cerebriforme TaxID=658196 RepID=A0A397S8Z9_9GLOM|nr:hypothetical protein C1645_744682 [Glomus cerebriforme]